MPSTNGVMVVADTEGSDLAPICAELLGIGRVIADQLGGPLSAVALGQGITEAAG